MKPCNNEVHAVRLRAAGVAPTRPRLEIARLLFARPVHWSAEQLCRRLRAAAQPVSRATVYNTLKLFCDKGLLRALHVDAGHVVYDSNPEPHPHLFDVDSGQVRDLPATTRRELENLLDESLGGDGRRVLDIVVRVGRSTG